MRRVVLLTILLFLIHFGITTMFVFRWTDTSKQPLLAAQFPTAFALALCTLPLYPIIGLKIGIFTLAIANSLLVAFVAALLVAYRRWRTILAIVIAVPLVIVAAAWLIPRGSMVPGPKRPPGDNAAAQTIDHIAKPLAVDPRMRASINDYFRREIERGDDAVSPLPQELEYFLVAHRFDLHAVEDQLRRGEQPIWASWKDSSRLFTLQKLILVDAMQDRSWPDIASAYRITRSFLDRDDIDGVFFAIAAADNQLGAARKLDPPATWPIERFDPYQAAFDAFATESDVATIRVPWYVRPYQRLALAESMKSVLEQVYIVRRMRGCRFTVPQDVSHPIRVSFNPIGLFNGAGTRLAARANRLMIDREGTDRVMAMKRGDTATVSSAICPDRKWTFSGGALRLQPDLVAPVPGLPAHHAMRTQ